MGVADGDLRAHHLKLVREEQPVLEHLLVDQHAPFRLRGKRDGDAGHVRRERGPRTVLDLGHPLARVVVDAELLAAGDDHIRAAHLAAEPEPVEHEPDHAQVLGHGVLDDELAAGDAGQRHERSDLNVVRRDRVRAPAEAAGAVDGHHVRADSVDRGPHRSEHPREVLDVGLRGRVADHGRAPGQRRGHQRVLGRHDRRLVHQEVAGPQAGRSLDRDVAVVLDRRAERAECIQVRVEPAPPDHVASGRRHLGAAEPGQQRAGEQEAGAKPLGQVAVDVVVVDPLRGDRDFARRGPRDAGTQRLEQQQHRLDIRDRGDVPEHDLVLRKQARGEDRQRAVLVSGRDDRAGQWHAAFDDELFHRNGRYADRVPRSNAQRARGRPRALS